MAQADVNQGEPLAVDTQTKALNGACVDHCQSPGSLVGYDPAGAVLHRAGGREMAVALEKFPTPDLALLYGDASSASPSVHTPFRSTPSNYPSVATSSRRVSSRRGSSGRASSRTLFDAAVQPEPLPEPLPKPEATLTLPDKIDASLSSRADSSTPPSMPQRSTIHSCLPRRSSERRFSHVRHGFFVVGRTDNGALICAGKNNGTYALVFDLQQCAIHDGSTQCTPEGIMEELLNAFGHEPKQHHVGLQTDPTMFQTPTAIRVASQREAYARVASQPLAKFPDEFLEGVNDLNSGRNSEDVDKHDASEHEGDDFEEGVHGDSPRRNSEDDDTHGASEYEGEVIHVIPVDEASAQVGESDHEITSRLEQSSTPELNTNSLPPQEAAALLSDDTSAGFEDNLVCSNEDPMELSMEKMEIEDDSCGDNYGGDSRCQHRNEMGPEQVQSEPISKVVLPVLMSQSGGELENGDDDGEGIPRSRDAAVPVDDDAGGSNPTCHLDASTEHYTDTDVIVAVARQRSQRCGTGRSAILDNALSMSNSGALSFTHTRSVAFSISPRASADHEGPECNNDKSPAVDDKSAQHDPETPERSTTLAIPNSNSISRTSIPAQGDDINCSEDSAGHLNRQELSAVAVGSAGERTAAVTERGDHRIRPSAVNSSSAPPGETNLFETGDKPHDNKTDMRVGDANEDVDDSRVAEGTFVDRNMKDFGRMTGETSAHHHDQEMLSEIHTDNVARTEPPTPSSMLPANMVVGAIGSSIVDSHDVADDVIAACGARSTDNSEQILDARNSPLYNQSPSSPRQPVKKLRSDLSVFTADFETSAGKKFMDRFARNLAEAFVRLGLFPTRLNLEPAKEESVKVSKSPESPSTGLKESVQNAGSALNAKGSLEADSAERSDVIDCSDTPFESIVEQPEDSSDLMLVKDDRPSCLDKVPKSVISREDGFVNGGPVPESPTLIDGKGNNAANVSDVKTPLTLANLSRNVSGRGYNDSAEVFAPEQFQGIGVNGTNENCIIQDSLGLTPSPKCNNVNYVSSARTQQLDQRPRNTGGVRDNPSPFWERTNTVREERPFEDSARPLASTRTITYLHAKVSIPPDPDPHLPEHLSSDSPVVECREDAKAIRVSKRSDHGVCNLSVIAERRISANRKRAHCMVELSPDGPAAPNANNEENATGPSGSCVPNDAFKIATDVPGPLAERTGLPSRRPREKRLRGNSVHENDSFARGVDDSLAEDTAVPVQIGINGMDDEDRQQLFKEQSKPLSAPRHSTREFRVAENDAVFVEVGEANDTEIRQSKHFPEGGNSGQRSRTYWDNNNELDLLRRNNYKSAGTAVDPVTITLPNDSPECARRSVPQPCESSPSNFREYSVSRSDGLECLRQFKESVASAIDVRGSHSAETNSIIEVQQSDLNLEALDMAEEVSHLMSHRDASVAESVSQDDMGSDDEAALDNDVAIDTEASEDEGFVDQVVAEAGTMDIALDDGRTREDDVSEAVGTSSKGAQYIETVSREAVAVNVERSQIVLNNNLDISPHSTSSVSLRAETESNNLENGDDGSDTIVRKKVIRGKKRGRNNTGGRKNDGGRINTGSRSKVRGRKPHKTNLQTVELPREENSTEGTGPRRSKRQRIPRLKFWKNEQVRYERRLSQLLPTISQVVVDKSESDDESWLLGRR